MKLWLSSLAMAAEPVRLAAATGYRLDLVPALQMLDPEINTLDATRAWRGKRTMADSARSARYSSTNNATSSRPPAGRTMRSATGIGRYVARAKRRSEKLRAVTTSVKDRFCK